MTQTTQRAVLFRFARLPLGTWLGPPIVGLIGLVMIHHPMLFSGLAQIQVDAWDSRLINYFLEHSFRWIARYPCHRNFWDMPFLYPTRNVSAHSDTMLGVAPIYWGWRALGFLPDTSFQLWMISASFLNYVSGYWLFRRGFGGSVAGSTGAAFLFAFGAARANQLGHQQLLCQFYVAVTLMALLRIFSGRQVSLMRSFLLWSVAGLSVVAQLYAGFYIGWFLVFALGIAACWSLLLAPYRVGLLAVLARQWPAAAGATVLSCVAIIPLLTHYLQVALEFGMRSDIEIEVSIPYCRSWIYMGPWNWIWAWTGGLPIFYDIGLNLEGAQRMGLGIVTPLVCVAGLALKWQDRAVRLGGLTVIGLLATTTRFQRETIDGVAVGLWAVSVIEIGREKTSSRGRQILGGLAIVLGLILFPAIALARALLAAVVALLISRLLPAGRRTVAQALIFAALIGFPCLTTNWHRPRALWMAMSVVAIIEAGRRRANRNIPLAPMVAGGVALIVTLCFFGGDINWWIYVCAWVPGGRAIRVVSRALLIVMTPAALGVACFFDWIQERRKSMVAAVAVALFCMAEQGVTTPSHDKYDKRAQTTKLARRIDPRCQAFYYSPAYPLNPIMHYHLDAMWAGIETGKPTINGYSSLSPLGWKPLREAGLNRPDDTARLGPALWQWAALNGLQSDVVLWIRGPNEAIFGPNTNGGRLPVGIDHAASGDLGARQLAPSRPRHHRAGSEDLEKSPVVLSGTE
jgi:hypothetical protein